MELKRNILREKFFDFAVRIVNLYKFLVEEKKEFVLSKQIFVLEQTQVQWSERLAMQKVGPTLFIN